MDYIKIDPEYRVHREFVASNTVTRGAAGTLSSLLNSFITYLLTYLLTPRSILTWSTEHTYLHHGAYLLTPRSRVLLEKPTGLQLAKKFLACYETRMFITAFTRARHLSLS
jgi:glucose-6-phosphate 1-dehydrogenase